MGRLEKGHLPGLSVVCWVLEGGGGGGLQKKGRQGLLDTLRRACLIASLYCLRQHIGRGGES